MSELEYDKNWAAELLAAGITPASDPINIRGVVKQILQNIDGGGGAVSSVFTRTGAITANTGDYTVAQVTGAAPLASPALTGTPTAPTQSLSDASTKIATDAFVSGYSAPKPVGSPTVGEVVNVTGTSPLTLGYTGITGLLGGYLGQTNGAVTPPWQVPPTLGQEFWALANFESGGSFQNSTLTPILTGNGNVQTSYTGVALGNMANDDTSFRVTLNVASMPVAGTASLSFIMAASGNTTPVAGSTEQFVVTSSSPSATGVFQFDFKIGPYATGGLYLVVKLALGNNVSSGSLQINGVSIQQVPNAQRALYYSFTPSIGPTVYQRLYDPVAKAWSAAYTIFGTDGALTNALTGMTGFSTDNPFATNMPDPAFVLPALNGGSAVGDSTINTLPTGATSRFMRVGNNDQVIEVQDSDGTWELRCNTHGGETLQGGYPIYQYDLGNDVWNTWSGANSTANHQLRTCRRFQFLFNTQITRTTPGDTIADVTHTATFFPDGVMRMDRSTTWLETINVGDVFEWLTSHDLSTPKIGRMGTGLLVLDQVDTFPKVAVPVAPTLGSTTGTIAAGTYHYGVTALNEGGETTLSPTASITLGGTGGVIVTLPTPPTGIQGWRVYGRSSTTGALSLLGTLGPSATTFTDDGTQPMFGTPPPDSNTARQLDSTSPTNDSAVAGTASWSVWYDPLVNMCFGNIYDRDAIANRIGVSGTAMRLEFAPGICKNYVNVFWQAGLGPVVLPINGVPSTRTVPANEVWTATHWSFVYIPADPVHYHNEIAYRSVDLSALKVAYPAT